MQMDMYFWQFRWSISLAKQWLGHSNYSADILKKNIKSAVALLGI